MVLFPHETHISRRFRGYLRNAPYRVTFDRAFRQVVLGCAEPRPGKLPLTWITPRIVEAYCRLFEAGHAHSVEVWGEGDRLVGGLYGVAIGRIFFTESMFARRPNASRIALVHLNCSLEAWGYRVNDVKRPSEFWEAHGARLIPRHAFTELVLDSRDTPGRPAPWRADESLVVAAWRPGAPRPPAAGDAET
jgi:leucyl/phenylalanyl-tRNA--protein transferase